MTGLLIINALAFLAVLVFITCYATVHWERSQEGQNAMAVSVAVLALCCAGLSRRFYPDSDAVSWIAYSLTVTVFIWRTVIFIRAQRDARRGRHE